MLRLAVRVDLSAHASPVATAMRFPPHIEDQRAPGNTTGIDSTGRAAWIAIRDPGHDEAAGLRP